ncbi:MAG: hypothetical protein IPP82_02585 [Xanthomonadales bacterium]|nr:hypothetical protein [Xanthomonadales bacterium]
MIAQSFRKLSRISTCTLSLIGFVSTAQAQAANQSATTHIVKSEVQGSNRREIQVTGETTPNMPLIGFIDSPTAGCYQPDRAENVCYINWYYLSVDASPNYMISMTAEINVFGKVATYQGFFQNSMFVPHTMHDRGFKVACGAIGSGGDPDLGKSYAYTIRAKDSAALSSANYGTVYCPAFVP